MPKLDCPQCKKPMKWDTNNPYRPFCSERCKLIDFGDWAGERNTIPANLIEHEEYFLEH